MLLANGLSAFPIKGDPVFRNDPKHLPKSPPDFYAIEETFEEILKLLHYLLLSQIFIH